MFVSVSLSLARLCCILGNVRRLAALTRVRRRGRRYRISQQERKARIISVRHLFVLLLAKCVVSLPPILRRGRRRRRTHASWTLATGVSSIEEKIAMMGRHMSDKVRRTFVSRESVSVGSRLSAVVVVVVSARKQEQIAMINGR